MNDPNSSPCPECGNPVPADSQHQVCPACLMAQALASHTLDGEKALSSPPPEPEEIADKFPQFEILECLGRGGMGIVYKARQKSLNRLVAIKILAPEREHDARFAERFAREAELLAKLSHPHIVTIHDFGETGGLYFLVMEFVDGVNLRDLLREGKLESKQALAIVPPICEALQYAHDKGIVHRDIKPENLLLDRDGRIKIADFGIASLIGASAEKSGTPPYMAPEQRGISTEVDHRADIYALGVVFYEMLTGERPAENLVAPSKKTPLDARLDEMVLRALEKEPEKRYQTAEDFRTRVETLGNPPPMVGRPAPLIATPARPNRFWWVYLVMLPLGMFLGIGGGALWNYLCPKIYEAQTIIQVIPREGTSITASFFPIEFEKIRSTAVLEEVGRRLELNQRWMMDDQEVVAKLRQIMSTTCRRGTDLIEIRIRDTDREESAEIANSVAEVFQTKGQVIIHERASTPTTAISPNAILLLGIGALVGLMISPFLAWMLVVLLRRGIPHSSTTSATPRKSSPLIIGCGVFCLLLFILFLLFGGTLFWLRKSNLDAARQMRDEVEQQHRAAVLNAEAAQREQKPEKAHLFTTEKIIDGVRTVEQHFVTETGEVFPSVEAADQALRDRALGKVQSEGIPQPPHQEK